MIAFYNRVIYIFKNITDIAGFFRRSKIIVKILIYTDGGCSGNPGPGGWAYVMEVDNELKKMSGGMDVTTNNKMELTAVIRALEDTGSLKKWKSAEIHLHTDSQYVKNGITNWITNWIRNGWKTANKKPVKNKEYWIKLKEVSDPLNIKWHWVKGHAGIAGNEECDSLVQEEIQKIKTN